MRVQPDSEDRPTLRLVNWNVEWNSSATVKGNMIKEMIATTQPHVVCLTESHTDFFATGHTVTAEADYGYGDTGTRRKVVLWSQTPWTKVELIGEPTLPGGRFVAATTSTPLGEIRFLGVCIPWRDAHVRTGRKDRKAWEDHVHFLVGLSSVLQQSPTRRLVLLGDFNQMIPRRRAPVTVFEQLNQVLEQFTCPTEGTIPNAPKPTVDHVCHTPDLVAESISVLSNQHDTVGQLSDHFGLSMAMHLVQRTPDAM